MTGDSEYRDEDAEPADERPAGVDKRADRDKTADTPDGALSPGTTASGSPTSGRGTSQPGESEQGGSEQGDSEQEDSEPEE